MFRSVNTLDVSNYYYILPTLGRVYNNDAASLANNTGVKVR